MKKSGNKKDKIKEELIEEVDQEIEEIEEDKINILESQLRRAVADYQNLEKRTEETRAELVMSSNRNLILKLLPVLDNLYLASAHIQDDGLKLSIKKFLDTLKEEGVEAIDTKDAEFDPHLMECVSVMAGEDGKVLEEVRKGYIMNDKVLRPAQVIVGSSEKQN
jgi:molecular chaperone GrpE